MPTLKMEFHTHAGGHYLYMFLRYCPPTSYSACVICPSEQYFTVSISSANKFPLVRAIFFNFFNASLLFDSLRWQKKFRFCICCSFSSVVLRMTSPGVVVGLPFLLRKVFTPINGNSPVC